jgi:hypothetical protein
MTDYVQAYVDLLIKQYWQNPNATAEIALQASTWERVFKWLDSFPDEFDLDIATGDRLDIIGRIVGIDRIIPFVVPKIAFGFAENPNARGFDDKFSPLANCAPFQDKFERSYTNLQLDDEGLRFFIHARIAKNVGSPYMVEADETLSIQDAINTLFDGNAYVLDNKDMSLTLYISPSYNLDRLQAIIKLDLLPKPQGVQYKYIVQAEPGETFGFSDNPYAQPFADKFDLENQPGGRFARKVLI